jgi:hypothetical protein
MRTKLFLEYLKGRHNSEDLDIDVKIILKLILGKLDVRMWTRFIRILNGSDDGKIG